MSDMEALYRGQKGDKGEKGERGLGITAGARRAIIYLFVLTVLLAGANLLWTSHVVNANQAAQQRAGQAVGQKLCATLSQLAALRPPGGSPAANPSRAYEQSLHTTLSQLGTDLSCPPIRKAGQK